MDALAPIKYIFFNEAHHRLQDDKCKYANRVYIYFDINFFSHRIEVKHLPILNVAEAMEMGTQI